MSSNTVKCPDCEFPINVEGGEIGDYFECDTCACELTLKSLTPPKVEVLIEEK